MKTIIVSPHSFVDIITNSSSELFICDTDKSIDTVKEIIVELVNIENKKAKLKGHEGYSIDTIFTDMFKEPEICPFNFPDIIELESFKVMDQFYCSTPHPLYNKCSREMEIWEKNNPGPKYPSDYNDQTAINVYWGLADIYNPIKDKKESEIFKPYFDIWFDFYKKVIAVYCSHNNINFSEIEFEDTQPSRYPRVHAKPGKHSKFMTELEDVISWGYTTKKGNIILRSISDNSIPYGMWDDLEEIFRAQRVHLG
jgi:hypothetical protein